METCRLNVHYSRREELFNGIIHIVGAVIGVAALALGIVFVSIHQQGAIAVLSMITYGIGLTVQYSMSATYHLMRDGERRRKFQTLDHCSIYLLIAATYTPYCLILMNHLAAGWILFGIVWVVAIMGVILNAVNRHNKIVRIFTVISYVGLGWCFVFVFGHMSYLLGTLGLLFMLIGGAIYTVGVIFYVISQKKRYYHSVWHVFVVVGSLFFFFSILFYVVIN